MSRDHAMQDLLNKQIRALIHELTHARLAGLPDSWFVPPAARDNAVTAITEPDPSADRPADAAADLAADKVLPQVIPPNVPLDVSIDVSTSVTARWAVVEREALGCTKCRLAETRCKVVFGTGRRNNPAIVFVGEGPGADEDRTGEPFVGKAGGMLTAAINKGLGLQREDVYICNVVKCRPPGNRTPLPDEVESCVPYLYEQLELLRPQVIVTLGQPAQLALSGVKRGITQLRGQWQVWRGIKLMPTFHPAYLLRTPSAKRLFWEDLQSVMREIGISRN